MLLYVAVIIFLGLAAVFLAPAVVSASKYFWTHYKALLDAAKRGK